MVQLGYFQTREAASTCGARARYVRLPLVDFKPLRVARSEYQDALVGILPNAAAVPWPRSLPQPTCDMGKKRTGLLRLLERKIQDSGAAI